MTLAHNYSLNLVLRYKSALRAFYASYSCTPVFFEVAKRMAHGVHSQMHAIPIPQSISLEEIEGTFHHTAKQMRIELQEENEEKWVATENYFMVEMPSGKTLVHVMDQDSRFPLQFARYEDQCRSPCFRLISTP
jgi:hypothetical protein